ncbi:hypothetical protein GQ53DRAFT_430884 [Thozetella sp. PMI_491]|nr:hypothetical protein GQ53DRAFT_430884 [Thozetella sp. PMI_491]
MRPARFYTTEKLTDISQDDELVELMVMSILAVGVVRPRRLSVWGYCLRRSLAPGICGRERKLGGGWRLLAALEIEIRRFESPGRGRHRRSIYYIPPPKAGDVPAATSRRLSKYAAPPSLAQPDRYDPSHWFVGTPPSLAESDGAIAPVLGGFQRKRARNMLKYAQHGGGAAPLWRVSANISVLPQRSYGALVLSRTQGWANTSPHICPKRSP